jgi:hypothetical protein
MVFTVFCSNRRALTGDFLFPWAFSTFAALHSYLISMWFLVSKGRRILVDHMLLFMEKLDRVTFKEMTEIDV